MIKSICIAVTILLFSPALALAVSPVLSDLDSEEELVCGVSTGVAGFSFLDELGKYSGLDVDFCRAIAAAIFGDDSRVRYVPLDSKERFDALEDGSIDILSRNTTWTLDRDAEYDFEFVGVMFYDGQGFLSNSGKLIDQKEDLNDQTICVQEGTTTESNLKSYKELHDLTFEISYQGSNEEAEEAYLGNKCSIYSNDTSALAGFKASITEGAKDHVTGTLLISKEPLGPVVREDQQYLADVARWLMNALLLAEELGITSANVDQIAQNPENIDAQKLLRPNDGGSSGACLGLGSDWAYNAILQVGNYGEIFEANVGRETALGLERGSNALFVNGGLMYALPFGSGCG